MRIIAPSSLLYYNSVPPSPSQRCVAHGWGIPGTMKIAASITYTCACLIAHKQTHNTNTASTALFLRNIFVITGLEAE